MGKTTFTLENNGKTLVSERTFNAPKDRVWEAYTNPDQLAKWWGPRGWKTEIRHMEFEDGGYWHYGMRCNDPEQREWYGKTSWGRGTFRIIRPRDAFEYSDDFCDEHGSVNQEMPVSYTRMTFEEKNGATTVTARSEYETPAELSQLLDMGMETGFAETWDRLAELVER
jgi:uncharacterized protein YndB with AHSA1/START domain